MRFIMKLKVYGAMSWANYGSGLQAIGWVICHEEFVRVCWATQPDINLTPWRASIQISRTCSIIHQFKSQSDGWRPHLGSFKIQMTHSSDDNWDSRCWRRFEKLISRSQWPEDFLIARPFLRWTLWFRELAIDRLWTRLKFSPKLICDGF